MLKQVKIFVVILILLTNSSDSLNLNLITNYTVKLLKTEQSVILSCSQKELFHVSSALQSWNQLVLPININYNFSLATVLTRKNHARTLIILDCSCSQSLKILETSSENRYFNKTYQWMLWDLKSKGLLTILDNVRNFGPNAQVTYVNQSKESSVSTNPRRSKYFLYDVHSKGRHLNAPIEVHIFAEWVNIEQTRMFHLYNNIIQLQSLSMRGQFNRFTLRGGSVIDLDNITTSEQIETILSRPTKDIGVAAFIKYHFKLLGLLRERFNFTLNFRNVRGWGGRLNKTRFRLGFLGIVKRDEVDIGASGSLNRINRFAEFDTIHQSWKFETAFVYRFTPDLNTHDKSGNFLAPFAQQVWIITICTVLAVNIIWWMVAWLNTRLQKQYTLSSESTTIKFPSLMSAKIKNDNETSLIEIFIKTIAAICQQGLDPIPNSLPSRIIVFTLIVFSLVIYNYYTSSVVGGLLSNSAQGPSTIVEITESPLKLSFEDIGYYKVLFKEGKSAVIKRLFQIKVLPKRNPDELAVFTQLRKAIPYLKLGGYAFHCEIFDAYPEIARHFDTSEICDLRIVSGLLETELLNWIITKNSPYTEIFRIMMCRARETGLIVKILRDHHPEKPRCQALYTVYSVNLSSVMSAFMLLAGGMFASLIVFLMEYMYSYYYL